MPVAEQTRVITLIALFGRTGQLMVDELIERLHSAGFQDVTTAHHPVFENIDAGGTRLTVLAARNAMTHQSMGELVETLERRGYLERRVDPADGRARLVVLTAKGRRLARRAIAEIGAIEREWMGRLDRAGLDADLRGCLESAIEEQVRESEAAAR